MAEDTTNQATGGNGQAQDGADQQPQLRILSQYVKDFSFENPEAPNSLSPERGMPQIDVNFDVQAQQVGDENFEVSLRVAVNAKHGEDTAFLIELVYGSLFLLRNIPPENLEPICLIECPRLIFPFARRIIADACRDGGFPPLMLDPIDFMALYQARQQAQAQTPQADDTESS